MPHGALTNNPWKQHNKNTKDELSATDYARLGKNPWGHIKITDNLDDPVLSAALDAYAENAYVDGVLTQSDIERGTIPWSNTNKTVDIPIIVTPSTNTKAPHRRFDGEWIRNNDGSLRFLETKSWFE